MTPRLSPDAWEAFLARHPDAHLLQSAAWGELKAHFGWEPVRLASSNAGAQLLLRRLAPGLTLAYVPRGPVGPWLSALLPDLVAECRARGAFALKVEPEAPEGDPLETSLPAHGFLRAKHAIQPRRTIMVDLAGSEDELLDRMHPKTRYNIRLSERKGVQVRPWDDLRTFHHLLQSTGERDAFGVHSEAYYRRAYELFHARGECELLVAEHDGRPLAALMVFARGSTAWYFYGASSSEGRNLMPTYALQWEAMRWARGRGCSRYDLWGVPDEPESVLESEFTRRQDGLWGVYRFKRGFGGQLARTAGAWDLVLRPGLYRLYGFAARSLRG
ncbi:MAG TPA: peptidoglycan bridge formation glycyltransferase FemA/FemB family protein [Anaerolineales bacterium]|nr:peptidoglycan bridge formation glycyltransferase FemA/FemB family protein [Anaerolineales bacterium]